eukprot:scaffold13523_cov39-Cyclotella_meneghiniana.AAC.6
MDSMAGVKSEGEMDVNFGNSLELRSGLEVTVDILRTVRVVVEELAVTKARERWGRRNVASAMDIIFIEHVERVAVESGEAGKENNRHVVKKQLVDVINSDKVKVALHPVSPLPEKSTGSDTST